jgi:hypothetical protein
MFLDHLGPFTVKLGENRTKVWLLCLACLWSRSINLVICPDLTVRSFQRGLQKHVFQEGLPSLVVSDLGSQLTVGANIIRNFLDNAETHAYFSEHGIGRFRFEHYFIGNSFLGSLVEVCVKFVKRLMYGAIRNRTLLYHDFELIVEQTIHIANKRPVAFKKALRDESSPSVPAVITPELLCLGRDLVSLNLIPSLQPDPDSDPEWKGKLGTEDALREQFSKLRRARTDLIQTYNDEFHQTLIKQAVNAGLRYKPVPHKCLKVKDLIILKDPLLKASHYPMAIVTETRVNDEGEVTAIIAKKGNSGEIVRRQVNSVIPIMSPDIEDTEPVKTCRSAPVRKSGRRSKREAARRSERITKDILKRA